ncbi:hypothetical protein ACTA71_007180 [Dictyostelium dimigraforme]
MKTNKQLPINSTNKQLPINSNNQIFFSIWRNIFLRNEILFHLRLFNKHINSQISLSYKEIKDYRFHSYLDKIQLLGDCDEINEPLPGGITEIKFMTLLKLSKFKNIIPTSTHTIIFDDFYNSPLDDSIGILPSSITSITFGFSFDQKIPMHFLPDNLQTLIFIGQYNQILEEDVLPSTITSIQFGYSFNQSLNGNWLPRNIKALKFGEEFSQPVEDINNFLPKSLTSLILPFKYNSSPVDFKMDGSLLEVASTTTTTTTTSSSSNNQNLEYLFKSKNNILTTDSIPNYITKLQFDNFFDQIIKPNLIPNSVISIKFGTIFNSSIETNSLPSNLNSIIFGGNCFNQKFDFSDLEKLETIIFKHYGFNIPLETCKLPPNLTSLAFDRCFNRPIPVGYFLKFPLKSLAFGGYDWPIKDQTLPSTLTSLNLGVSSHLGSFINSLPQLETFVLGSRFNGKLEIGQLPNSIKTLSLPGYNKTIDKDVLPSNLISITFGNLYNQPFENNTLPSSLTFLDLGKHFNQKFNIGTLPNSITFLSLASYSYQHHFPVGSLPLSLKELRIHSYYFNQDFSSSFDDYFTFSLEKIYINKYSKLTHILNVNFFSKYIKFLTDI